MAAQCVDELLAIYKKYYSANIMKLVVLGNQSLDELQAMVEPRFGPVANNQVVVDALERAVICRSANCQCSYPLCLCRIPAP